MPEATHTTSSTGYASKGDFHQIFHEEKDSLYRLSFLLTADRERAQQCFVSGLENSVKGNPVFKEWARSWARRTIIQCAVRVIQPRPTDPSGFGSSGKTLEPDHSETATVLDLEPFERFVYVMSVLERYSDQDCSVLLACTRRDVIAARVRASQQIELQSTFSLSAS